MNSCTKSIYQTQINKLIIFEELLIGERLQFWQQVLLFGDLKRELVNYVMPRSTISALIILCKKHIFYSKLTGYLSVFMDSARENISPTIKDTIYFLNRDEDNMLEVYFVF